MKNSLAWIAIFGLSFVLWGCDTSRVDSVNLTAEGMRFYENGQIGKALDSFKKAVEVYPQNHQAYYRMGIIYNGRLDDPTNAIVSLKKAVEIRPDDGRYWYFLGYAQQKKGLAHQELREMEEAINYFNQAKQSLSKAIEVDEFYAEAHYRLGRLHKSLGEISQAIDAYSNAIHSDPMLRTDDESETAVAYLELGLLYAEYSFLDEASLVLINGIANNPEDVKLHATLGNVYQDMKSYTQGIDHFFKAYRLHQSSQQPPENILPALYGLGFCYSALGDENLDASNISEAKKNFEESKKWLDEFVSKAGGDELTPQRLVAQGRASELSDILKELEQGRLPQYIIDRQEMNEGAH